LQQRERLALQPFKPLSPETIKAGTTNRTAEASICQNQDALSQCNTLDAAINLEPARAALRDDELKMNL
jgi:hypothetical protein